MDPKHYRVSIADVDAREDDDPTLRMQRDAFGRLDPDHELDEPPRGSRARRSQERRRHRW